MAELELNDFGIGNELRSASTNLGNNFLCDFRPRVLIRRVATFDERMPSKASISVS